MLLFLNQFPVSVFVSSYETFFHVYLRRVSSSTSFVVVVEFVNNFWWNVLRLRTFSFTWLSFGAGDRSLSDDFLARRQMAFNSPLCLAHKSAFLPWQFQLPQSRPWRSDHASWTQIAAEPEKNRHCVSFNCHLQFTSSRCCCCLNSFQNDFINNHESAQQKIIELDRIRSEQRWIKNQLIKWNKKKIEAQEMILPVCERTNRAASYSFHQWIQNEPNNNSQCCFFLCLPRNKRTRFIHENCANDLDANLSEEGERRKNSSSRRPIYISIRCQSDGSTSTDDIIICCRS